MLLGESCIYKENYYPPGWRVIARKLKDGSIYDKNGLCISFYQSGCFTVVNENIVPLRKMEKDFKMLG